MGLDAVYLAQADQPVGRERFQDWTASASPLRPLAVRYRHLKVYRPRAHPELSRAGDRCVVKFSQFAAFPKIFTCTRLTRRCLAVNESARACGRARL